MVRFYKYVEPSKKRDSIDEPAVSKMQNIAEAIDEY